MGPISVHNGGESETPESKVLLSLAEYADQVEITVPSLGPNDRRTIDPPPLRIRREKLTAITEPHKCVVELYSDENPTIVSGAEIAALGIWHWPHAEHFLKALAAYVVPHHPCVEHIVMMARSIGPDDPVQSVTSSDSHDREEKVAKLLYRVLASDYEIAYEEPGLRHELNGRLAFQAIRPPHQVLPGSPDAAGMGTCLDLALLFAACLENLGLCPVLLVMGEAPFEASHAIAGLWTGRIPGGRTVVRDKTRIMEEIDAGNIVICECTGFAACPSRRERKLSFRKAVKKAKTRLNEAPWAALIDIVASRPPRGSVTPISAPEEPEAACVYEEAKLLAQRSQRRTVETVNILYGLLKCGGETTAHLTERISVDVAEVIEEIETRIETHGCKDDPVPTRTFEECRRLAEQIAWTDSVPSVRERDVWWALLEKREQSQKLVQICEECGLDLDQLATILPSIHPCPTLPVVTGALSRT